MRRSLTLLLVLLALPLLLIARLDLPAHAQAPAAEPLRTAGDRPVDIRNIRLDLKVDLPNKTVTGSATLSLRTLRRLTNLSLDAVELEVQKVVEVPDGKGEARKILFHHDGKHLILDFEPALPPEAARVYRIDYRVREPRAGLHFFGPTSAEPDVPLTVWSQGEPITNRYWIPCLDQPNQRQTTELVVTVAEGFEVLSNGALVERKTNPDESVTFHWRQDKPHPSYLVTMVIGQFDVVREEWNKLPVLYYVPRGKKPDVARTFGRTREMLDFFSRRFGIAYPWEKYAQIVVEQFTSGGMENTSATTLTQRALHDERAMLDSTPDALIAHELAHQWWGDLVTCRDWAHLWLNEGFASYCEALWDEHKNGRDTYSYTMLVKSRLAIAGGKTRPIVDHRYPSPRMMFDARAYPKGAFVLHMLRHRLGERSFWKGLQHWGTAHRLQSVETRDLRRTMEKVTGRDLERFFHDWTERPGHPVLEVSSSYEPDSRLARVVVRQTQAGDAFHFPLEVRFTTAGAKSPLLVKEAITEKEQRFLVPLSGRPTRIEIDPDQMVLAEIKEQKGRDLWLAQLADSPSISSRVRAAEHLGASKAPADREALSKALGAEKFWGVQLEIAAALGASGGDTCRDALIAGLKQKHPKVRRACASQLGKFRRDPRAILALKDVLNKGDASYFVEAAALSSYASLEVPGTVSVLLPWLARPSHNEVLRTAALSGLAKTRDLSALDTLIVWTKRGKPRTCRVAALTALAQVVKTANPNAAERKRVVEALAACLEGESWPIRRAVVIALRDVGRSATPTLSALEALAQHDPEDRVREGAKLAIAQIRANTPAPLELTRLREELDRLRRKQETLRDRLDRQEKIERKGAKTAG